MDFWNRTVLSALAVGLGLALNGCEPSGQNTADDEKEPHYVLGQNRVNAMDYSGAVEAFEQSLESNPHSAPAHYQLAMLYSEKTNNPAAAIYHYQQYLLFDPKAPNADIIKQHITNCMQQLAADVLQLPSSSAVLLQLQQLVDTNRQLQAELAQWRAYYASQTAAVKSNLPPVPNDITSPPSAPLISQQPAPANPKPTAAKPRTHTVAGGETPTAIARKYGVSLNALLAANPGLQPTHMRIGQSINLPPP